MKSIFSFFLDLEKLIYKILMWFILVPKTLVMITLNPAWAPGYVKDELQNDQTPFDEYISPIILLLVVALIPAVAFNLLPTFGASISSPAETQTTTERIISFEARTDFRSSSTEMEYFHKWTVTKAVSTTPTAGGDVLIASEVHYPSAPVNYVEEIDDNTVKDKFLFTFPDPGEYLVVVTAGKYDPRRYDPSTQQGVATEFYTTTMRVNIPVKVGDLVTTSNEEQTKDTDAASPENLQSFTASVQKENTLFIAIALMLPPLLFALATRLFITSIGEDTLKESFYTQCYYFSPLALAIWASYYARYFFSADAYFFASGSVAVQVIWLPTVLAMLWWVRAEVKTIEDARETTGVRSLIITLVCVALLLLAASGIFQFATLQDDARLLVIRIYPIVAAAMIAGFGIAWYRRRRARNEFMKPSHVAGIMANAIVMLLLLGYISSQFEVQSESPSLPQTEIPQATSTELAAATQAPGSTESSVPSTPSDLTTQTPLPEATATGPAESPTPTPDPYYVEEFNTDLTKWSNFMTSGDSRMVIPPVIDRGVLPLQLLQVDDRVGQFYLINDAFSYSDVKVEAVVTNRGNNSNGVGLICRYSNVGWYEAQFSNSQQFAIYVVDSVGLVNQGYSEVLSGDSKLIRSGPSTNVYTLTCKGNTISLSVNGELVGEYVDTHLGLTDGKIGLSVWSPQTLPVIVDVETLTVSAP